MIKQSRSSVAWPVIIPVLIWGEVLGKLLLLSSLRRAIWSGCTSPCRLAGVCPAEAQLFPSAGAIPSRLLVDLLWISPVLPGCQGGCKVKAESKDRWEIGADMTRLSPAFG
jgi:hypothetical protein